MDLDKLIEYLYTTDQINDQFGLKEKCPSCNTPLEETDDNAFPYYCPKCKMFINKDKTEGIINTK